MKKPLLFLLPLTLFSCTTGKQLTETESLIQSNPDSARVILRDWDRSTLVFPRQKALHALLYSMALDKCYIDVADDSLTSVALNYFKNSRDKDHRMKAYYYDGLVQKNSGNAITAILHLEKALSLSKEERNLHYEGLITRNLCMLHYEEWDFFAAEHYIQKSYEVFKEANEGLYARYSLLGWARCARMANHPSKADSLFMEVLQYDNKDSLFTAEVMLSYASLKMGRDSVDVKDVLRLVSTYERVGGAMTVEALITKARAQIRDSQLDSAEMTLNKAILLSETAIDSAKYYYGQYEYLKALGHNDKADGFREQCQHIQDSLTIERLKRSVAYAEKEWYRKDDEQNKQLADNRFHIILLLFLILVLGIAVVSNYVQKKRKAFSQELDRFQAVEGELKEQIMQLTENDDEQKASIVSLIVGRISVITMLGRQYSALQDSPAEESGFDRFERQKQVVQQCKQEIEALQGDKTFLIGFEEAVDKSYDHVITRLRALFGPKMTEQDYQIIAMLVAGTPVKGISLVTGLEPGTISTRKTRYKDRIRKTGTPDADFFIERIYRKPITAPDF